MNTFRKKLQLTYRSFFGEDNNSCLYAKECQSGMCQDGIRFNCAHLGELYGADPNLPKILVVGKEPVSEHRYIKEPVSLEDAGYNPHYLKTLYTLSLLLGDPADDYNKCDSLLAKESLLSRFCLTNYYKCVFTETKTEGGVKSTQKRSDKKGNPQMKKHCAEILIEEIRALTPDIVVVQGKDADNAKFRNLIHLHFGQGTELFAENGIWLYKHNYENNPFYILWSYHPTARHHLWAKTSDALNTAVAYFKDCFSQKKTP